MPDAPASPNIERVVLRDGSVVHVRPISAADVADLASAFERLTPESRYRRFFSPMKRLDSKALAYFTNIDHTSHEALVAVEPDHGEFVGVARYVSTEAGSETAEVAVVVADGWQGRGLATVLLAELTTRARGAGILRFRASCLAMNHDAIDVLKALGPTSLHPAGSGLTDLTIELSQSSADAALQTALGHVARGDAEHPPKRGP